MTQQNNEFKLLFLGSGGAFSKPGENYHSNVLITIPSGKSLLFDCGTDIKHSLHEANAPLKDIDGIYLSHLHFDHVGGLSWIAFENYFINKKKIKLYIHKSLVNSLWKSIKEDVSRLYNEMKHLTDYFEVVPVDKDFVFWGKKFSVIKNLHIYNPMGSVYSYGISSDDGKFIISGDTSTVCERTVEPLAYTVFHDCDLNNYKTNVHCDYEILSGIKRNELFWFTKIYLYHCTPTKEQEELAIKDGFLGVVKKGQSFTFEDKSAKVEKAK